MLDKYKEFKNIILQLPFEWTSAGKNFKNNQSEQTNGRTDRCLNYLYWIQNISISRIIVKDYDACKSNLSIFFERQS